MHSGLAISVPSQTIDPIYDPATGNPDGTGRTQFDCDGMLNIICPDRLSQAATNLLALVPEPNISGAIYLELRDLPARHLRPKSV